ncbi:MAG: protein kinase [Acidobacteriota bacterium]
MTPGRWQKIDQLLDEVLELQPRERAAFLDVACVDDDDLRCEVESLLAASHHAGDFIETPPLSSSDASESDFASMAGQPLGPYILLREIGRGGMGVVYHAARADDEFNKQVAIKLVQPGPHNKDLLRRFRRERQILANLDHPNIARLLDGGRTEQGVPYLVMEYVEGAPMTEYCDELKLSITERLKLFRNVCAVVQYAHQNLVIHRDLKPSNILVTVDGSVKLLDFGIAKLLDADPAYTTSATTAGLPLMTPEYASPEQIRGEPVSTASDVYSLGIVLYELLTGHYPYRFKDRSLPEIIRVICEQEPESPSHAISRIETRPEANRKTQAVISPESVSRTREGKPDKLRARLRGDLNDIALMALRKDPQQRYRTVEQLSEDIRRHLEGRPVLARKGTLVYRASKFIRRYRAAAAVAAIILLTLLGGILATTRQASIARQETHDKRRLLYAAEMHMAEQAWEANNIARLRELVERQAPREGEEDLRGFEWYYLWRLYHESGEVFTLHHDILVLAVAFSPDGRLVASGDDSGLLTLWNAATGEKIAALREHEFIWDVKFSPDGKLLATVGDHGTVKVWDSAARKVITSFSGHTEKVFCIHFSSDGKKLASGSQDGTARVWDVATGFELTRISAGQPVRSLAFSPDGKTLALKQEPSRAVTIFDAMTGRRLLEFASAEPVAFLPDGNSLVAIAGKTVIVIDTSTGTETAVLRGHTGRIVSVDLSPDGKTLATGSEDLTARLWDVATGAELRTLKGHEGTVFSVAFSPDGSTLATASSDLTARLWDISSVPEICFIKTSDQRVVFSPNRSQPVVASFGTQVVKLLDPRDGRLVAVFEGDSSVIWSAAFSPDGATLATGDSTGNVKLWDTVSKQALATLKAHTDIVSSLMFSPDGRMLATASYDKTAKLWDAATGQLILDLPEHNKPISAVAFSVDNLIVATGSHDGTARLCDARTGRELNALKGHARGILSMAFSPDGTMLAIGSGDGTVGLWDAKAHGLIARLAGHTENVHAVAFSPDSRRLATGSNDGMVRLWDTSTHQEVIALPGHTSKIQSVAFSPDGDTLVSGSSQDRTVRFWRASTHEAALLQRQE